MQDDGWAEEHANTLQAAVPVLAYYKEINLSEMVRVVADRIRPKPLCAELLSLDSARIFCTLTADHSPQVPHETVFKRQRVTWRPTNPEL